MKFGLEPVAEAQGAILAHSVDLGGRKLKKGVLIGPEEVAALTAAGLPHVIVARLEPGEVAENAAADRLARALVPDPDAAGLRLTQAFTGRVNLIADGPGVVVMDTDRLHTLNRAHSMITLATVPPHQQMTEGGMVGTVKIIAYGVPGGALDAACAAGQGAIRLARPVLRSATLIVTEISGGAGDKGRKAIAGRLEALGMMLDTVEHVPHRAEPLAQAIARATSDLILILTGSATSDPADVGPSALIAAGGQVARFGMPVDPGNLLFLGHIGDRPVIGLPGCARSPALNGADWVLSRIACGIPVSGDDIAGMGVGGLLKEIPTRPQPRAGRGRRDT